LNLYLSPRRGLSSHRDLKFKRFTNLGSLFCSFLTYEPLRFQFSSAQALG